MTASILLTFLILPNLTHSKIPTSLYPNSKEMGPDLTLQAEDPLLHFIDAKFYDHVLQDSIQEQKKLAQKLNFENSRKEKNKKEIRQLKKKQAQYKKEKAEILKKKIAALKEVYEQDQASAQIKYELSYHLAQSGSLNEAYSILQEALTLEKKKANFHVLLGRIFSLQKKRLLSLHAFGSALKLEKNNEEAFRLSVREYLLAKNFNQAIAMCLRWIRVSPRNKIPYFNLATIYSVFKKQPQTAIAYLKKILDFDPDDRRSLENLARLYSEQKNEKLTLKYLLAWAKVQPRNLDVQYRLGLMYLRARDYEKSLIFFKRVLKVMPGHNQVLYYTGLIFEIKKDKPQAIDYLEKVQPHSDVYQDALLRRMLLLVDSHQEKKAIKELKKIITKKEEASFYDVLAAIYSRHKKYPQALKVLSKALKKYPQHEKLLFSKGVLLDKMGKIDASILEMERLLKVNPQHALALNYVGYSLADQNKDLTRALKLILQANQLRPKDGYILDSVGWVHFRLGKIKQAIQYLNEALKYTPDEYVLLEHLGDIHRHIKNEKQAKNYYQRSIDVLKKKKKLDWRESEDLQKLENHLR